MCRNGCGGFLVVDRDAHDLRAGQSQGRDLFDGAGNVRRVGVGHRLHDDRNLPADANLPDFDRRCLSALNLRHADLSSSVYLFPGFTGNRLFRRTSGPFLGSAEGGKLLSLVECANGYNRPHVVPSYLSFLRACSRPRASRQSFVSCAKFQPPRAQIQGASADFSDPGHNPP